MRAIPARVSSPDMATQAGQAKGRVLTDELCSKLSKPLMSEMLNNNLTDNGVNGKGTNGEAASPGRCPTVQQGGPNN